MTRLALTIILCCGVFAASAGAAQVQVFKEVRATQPRPGTEVEARTSSAPARQREFTFRDRSGNIVSAPIASRNERRKIVGPVAKVDPRLDPRLTRAVSIAQERAHARSRSRCWRYVKQALVAAGVVDSYPKSAYAKEAGEELVRDFGFKKLPIRDPYAAPVGAVLVYYKGRNRPGHVEIRTRDGFVSDFVTPDACRYPLIGAYAKSSTPVRPSRRGI